MSLLSRTSVVVAVWLVLAPAVTAAEMSWSKDLTKAFAEAKKTQKILMICVNAKYVTGRKTEEPAAKGLREVVYKDSRVVAKSREFVCAFLTPGSGASEFGELRALGIDGNIVSPQHIFVNPDGDKILLRRQYWSHGKGTAAVNTLLAWMDEAQKALASGKGKPEADAPKADNATPKDAPAGEGRAVWIGERLQEVVEGERPDRVRAIELLILNDEGGDCTTPLILLLSEHKKNTALIVDLIRGLGRDQLLDAAELIPEFLSHRKEAVRANAAVSLEYIGSREPKVVAALRRAAGKEKDEAIANHMYRALGRCGVEDSKARALLLKKCGSAKSEFSSYGPTIGLAYFEGDPKAARGMEKILKKIGVPGGRRGGGQNTVKRGVLCWTMAAIGDEKSGKFMREQLIARLHNVKAFWVEGLKSFYLSVARKCEGKEVTLETIAEGVGGFVSFAKGMDPVRYGIQARSLMDEYRKGREAGGFTPMGDYLLGAGGDP
ncbi:MAG: HEAT repeat domain-containing protein [Planctomycetota bacterium]|nr:HEAT repeat domain-containing protein [Planctomycetota bacterium]